MVAITDGDGKPWMHEGPDKIYSAFLDEVVRLCAKH